MKILFLDAYFEPEQIAFTHLENDLLEGLVHAGHEVEIVCPTPTRGVSREIAEKYRYIKSEYLYDGHVHVTRFSAPKEEKTPFIRALRYFWCNLRTYQIGRKASNIDVVFANSTPPTQGLVGGIVAKKLGVPFVFSLQDVFPDSLVNAEMTKERSLFWNIGRFIENKTYENATTIITISESFRNSIICKHVEPMKIEVIPNWIDTSMIQDIPRKYNKIIKKYNLNPSKFYICYCGTVGHSQNIDLLVDVAEMIENRCDDICFVIIGEGATKDKLLDLVSQRRLTNVKCIPFQPYEDISHVFSLGDIGLIISKPGVGGSSVPSKTWGIMAARRPVLASFDEGTMLEEVINNADCGVLIKAGNKELFVDEIERLFNNKKLLKEYSDHGHDFVKNVINKERCVQAYVDCLVHTKK